VKPALQQNEEWVELGEMQDSVGLLLRLAQVKNFNTFYETMDGELSPGELTVLMAIGLNPGMRQGTIARNLLIKAAHMTKLVERMVKAGYVTRTVGPEDRRSVCLSLTDDGQLFTQRYRARLALLHDNDRATLTDAEYNQFITLLKKYTGSGQPT